MRKCFLQRPALTGNTHLTIVRRDTRAQPRATTRLIPVLALGLVLCSCGDSPVVPEPTVPPLSHLSLFPQRRAAIVGEQLAIAVTARDVNGADVPNFAAAFTSSNPSVVVIETDGRIVARGVGSAVVRVNAGGRSAETIVYVGAASYDMAAAGPPRVLDANYIDLSKIERISRFRSAIGHSYTDGSETCRSMKHYYQPKTTLDWRTVDVYAPAAGTILLIAADGAFGQRVLLRPRDLPALNVAIFHVELDPGIVSDTWVDAGDHIGRHSSTQTMSDIAISIGPKEGGQLISFFDAMTDAVFAQYQARGVSSRNAAIITKAERDTDPVPCVGESQFLVQGTLPNWLQLN